MSGLVKIGYASNPEKRRKELSHASGVPADFEIYAIYAVPVKLADKKVHNLIMALNSTLKFNPKKEFFTMEPDTAYKIFESLAAIHGRLNKLFKNIDGVPIAVSNDSEEVDVLPDVVNEPVKANKQLSFGTEILLNGGKRATNYLKKYLVDSGYVDTSWKITHACLNADGKRYWANPDVDYLKSKWCLVLNNQKERKLFVLKIAANAYSCHELKTRVKDGKKLLNIAIVHQENLFVCVYSKVNFTKWFADEFDY